MPEPKRVEHVDLPPPKPLWHEDNRGRRVQLSLALDHGLRPILTGIPSLHLCNVLPSGVVSSSEHSGMAGKQRLLAHGVAR